MEAKTFREAYDVLQRHAETLRSQDEPNIDDLLDIVNESVAAYKVCKQRIDAVEKALEQALVGAGIEADARPPARAPGELAASAEVSPLSRAPAAKPRSTGFDDMDRDIPF